MPPFKRPPSGGQLRCLAASVAAAAWSRQPLPRFQKAAGLPCRHVAATALAGRRLWPQHCTVRGVGVSLGAVAAGASADLGSWSVRQLRQLLDERGISHADCFEKQDLVQRAQSVLKQDTSAQDGPQLASAGSRFSGFGELLTIQGDTKDATMIFLHGLGDAADGWASMLPRMLQVPNLRYVLPTAESLSWPGAPAGQGVTSWFDASVLGAIFGGGSTVGLMSTVRSEVMRTSIDYCHHLLRAELRRGVPARRLFLGGFSQGGCLAARAALAFPDAPLGGCIAASTFLGDAVQLAIADANLGLQVLCCHGDADQVVPTTEGLRMAEELRRKKVGVEWRMYPGMGHTSCAEQAVDMRRFIQRQLLLSQGEVGLAAMPARNLKLLLRDLGIDTSGCFDKSDLLERARLSMPTM